ncbi:hypothetical protein EWM64_g5058 [Hericium alpestre]|uniref:Uncharacterized protein n=1 Tax=Hericium alpestre TaxID=135208 RepID=A0A4Y9ZYD6_9AGAM|nr:hypothetical protein EWM64_g5058 [Hericium alpestre]
MGETTTLSVHRCRFVDYTPPAITALAFPPLPLPSIKGKKKADPGRKVPKVGTLVVGRANGNIELCEWTGSQQDVQAPQAWVVRKTLAGPNPSKADSIALTLKHPDLFDPDEVPSLADLRLFSTGGGTANPASTLLALGCEDGSVHILSLEHDTLSHLRRLDRSKSRILSIAWGPPVPRVPTQPQNSSSGSDDSDEDDEDQWSDSWLVAGCSDSSLRKWDLATGRVVERMATDKMRGERTLVWAVSVLGDGTVVSGDSLGLVKFWDARTCTQLHSFQGHNADVLCLTIGPEGTSVYSSGVDQKTTQYTQIKSFKSGSASILSAWSRWVQTASKRMHSHDVRALAIELTLVDAGGIASDTDPERPMPMPMFRIGAENASSSSDKTTPESRGLYFFSSFGAPVPLLSLPRGEGVHSVMLNEKEESGGPEWSHAMLSSPGPPMPSSVSSSSRMLRVKLVFALALPKNKSSSSSVVGIAIGMKSPSSSSSISPISWSSVPGPVNAESGDELFIGDAHAGSEEPAKLCRAAVCGRPNNGCGLRCGGESKSRSITMLCLAAVVHELAAGARGIAGPKNIVALPELSTRLAGRGCVLDSAWARGRLKVVLCVRVRRDELLNTLEIDCPVFFRVRRTGEVDEDEDEDPVRERVRGKVTVEGAGEVTAGFAGFCKNMSACMRAITHDECWNSPFPYLLLRFP